MTLNDTLEFDVVLCEIFGKTRFYPNRVYIISTIRADFPELPTDRVLPDLNLGNLSGFQQTLKLTVRNRLDAPSLKPPLLNQQHSQDG